MGRYSVVLSEFTPAFYSVVRDCDMPPKAILPGQAFVLSSPKLGILSRSCHAITHWKGFIWSLVWKNKDLSGFPSHCCDHLCCEFGLVRTRNCFLLDHQVTWSIISAYLPPPSYVAYVSSANQENIFSGFISTHVANPSFCRMHKGYRMLHISWYRLY